LELEKSLKSSSSLGEKERKKKFSYLFFLVHSKIKVWGVGILFFHCDVLPWILGVMVLEEPFASCS